MIISVYKKPKRERREKRRKKSESEKEENWTYYTSLILYMLKRNKSTYMSIVVFLPIL
jgi:hypothetical protein